MDTETSWEHLFAPRRRRKQNPVKNSINRPSKVTGATTLNTRLEDRLTEVPYLYVTVQRCTKSNISLTQHACACAALHFQFTHQYLGNVRSPSGSFCRLYKTRYSISFPETVQASNGTSHSVMAPRSWSNSGWEISPGPVFRQSHSMQLLGEKCHMSEGNAALATSRCTRSSVEIGRLSLPLRSQTSIRDSNSH
jgi:hypothetical protein